MSPQINSKINDSVPHYNLFPFTCFDHEHHGVRCRNVSADRKTEDSYKPMSSQQIVVVIVINITTTQFQGTAGV